MGLQHWGSSTISGQATPNPSLLMWRQVGCVAQHSSTICGLMARI